MKYLGSLIKRKPKVEIKLGYSYDWQRIGLVDSISIWNEDTTFCGDTGLYFPSIPPSITIEFIGGGETYVHDVRINGGRSLREQWEGDCNG